MSTDKPISEEPEFEQLLTVAQFRARMQGRFGVIVIDDKTRDQPIAHDRGCPFISEESFVEKVLDMGGRQGRYFWAKNSRIAAERLGARRCRHPGDRLAGG